MVQNNEMVSEKVGEATGLRDIDSEVANRAKESFKWLHRDSRGNSQHYRACLGSIERLD